MHVHARQVSDADDAEDEDDDDVEHIQLGDKVCGGGGSACDVWSSQVEIVTSTQVCVNVPGWNQQANVDVGQIGTAQSSPNSHTRLVQPNPVPTATPTLLRVVADANP
jgi:hypothetical protein